MRLTQLGREYHVAILFLVVSGVLSGEALFVGLGLALALASFSSLLLLRLRSRSGVRVEASGLSARVFKNDTIRTELRIIGPTESWVELSVESARFEGPIDVDEVHIKGGLLVLRLTPRASGRYKGLVLGIRVHDTLNLFTQLLVETRTEVVVDSLPRSLLTSIRSPVLTPLVLGESPAGRPGRGQEFYGVDEYSYGSESRDILWKRAARRPESPLLVKVRESNIPSTTTIKVSNSEGLESPVLTDLLCEALGLLGRGVLGMGVDLLLLAPNGRKLFVGDDGELADAIMEISSELGSKEDGFEGETPADVSVNVGLDGVEPDDSRPSVVISEHPSALGGRFVFPYTGVEDLTQVISLVMAR